MKKLLFVGLSFSLLLPSTGLCATEPSANVTSEKDKSLVEVALGPSIEDELRQLIKDMTLVNNYTLFVLATGSLAVTWIMFEVFLMKMDVEAIRRAVT